ncbi:VOC family protein [Microcella sp.]|uniref:VOC family protein n=1 Tax=Microcella sp. TaxID=1913979 RepID=UPI00299F596C|nr:VOC family protein [Microcella sp.]MDX2025987.1 VOC family protein [Microcella sp.]
MIDYAFVFSGFAVSDIDAARAFYRDTLGLTVTDESMGHLSIELPAGGFVLVYPKDDHVAASYTMLNLEVNDIDAAVDELTGRGVTFERYAGMPHDDRGIIRGIAADQGPDIAWFTDPSGNIISVLQNAG